jgi:NAD(P)-dependent dehydrogenase (short-subunit alcohol dehydrogenase family)
MKKEMKLPKAIETYVKAINAGDADGLQSSFAHDAVVKDVDREIRGIAAIKEWADREIFAVNVTLEVEPKPFEDISDEDWRRFFEVDVLSGVRLSRAYLPGMKQRNWGRIVFISSESAINTPAEMIHYGMTKTAQLAVSPAWPRPRPTKSSQRSRRAIFPYILG